METIFVDTVDDEPPLVIDEDYYLGEIEPLPPYPIEKASEPIWYKIES